MLSVSAVLSSSDPLLRALEHRFEAADLSDASVVTGVIALGGGVARIREACRLGRLHPHLRVFISGEGDEADVRGKLGPAWHDCKFELENQSVNTYTNAVYSRAHLKPHPGQRWLLVTSAIHMPRAMGAFRRAGFAVEPWPVFDTRAADPQIGSAARHELIGLAVYWLRGHSSALFPAPVERTADAGLASRLE